MKNLVKSIVCLIAAGCAAERGASVSDNQGGAFNQGGMDGAGQIGTGLRFDAHVAAQAYWGRERLGYMVMNDRADEVELLISRPQACRVRRPDGSYYETFCGTGPSVLGPWKVPAGALRLFAGDELAVLQESSDLFQFHLGDGTALGLDRAPRRPLAGPALPIVTTHPVLPVQLETDFVVAPGPSFAIVISMALASDGGQLALPRHTPAQEAIEFLDVVAVRSDSAAVHASADGFRVDLTKPPNPPEPTRVEVDVSVPANFSGRGFIGFTASMCFAGSHDTGCLDGSSVTRVIPLRE